MEASAPAVDGAAGLLSSSLHALPRSQGVRPLQHVQGLDSIPLLLPAELARLVPLAEGHMPAAGKLPELPSMHSST